MFDLYVASFRFEMLFQIFIDLDYSLVFSLLFLF